MLHSQCLPDWEKYIAQSPEGHGRRDVGSLPDLASVSATLGMVTSPLFPGLALA